jgi:8-oxo-dGTP pyrophosphatase MutT (NUDIX family)
MRFREQVLARLGSLEHRVLTSGFNREAAVLILVFERDGEPHFLLTRRTEEVETHKGQISFPGGMREDAEPLKQTALRETFEEIGIESARIEILGRFHDYISVTEYRVSPFVGIMEEPFTVTPQPREVAEVLSVPFHIFHDPSRLRVEQIYRTGRIVDVYFYSYRHYTIWGLTAQIIKDFLEELRRV